MRLQSFCHPTLIHCTCGAQTLSPRPLHRQAPQTLSRLAQCKVPPVPVTITSPAAPHSPPDSALSPTPGPAGPQGAAALGPLVPSTRPIARRHEDSGRRRHAGQGSHQTLWLWRFCDCSLILSSSLF